jgi:XTP/dITP diphosphohydrolase
MVAGIATFDAWCSASMTSTAPPPALPAPGITLARLRKTPLVVATHNAGKVGELLTLLAPLGVTGVGAAGLGLHEPDETEETFTGNALLKASLAAAQTGRVALADDSGVCVDALGGAPGIYTARWAGEPRDWKRAMKRVEFELADRGAALPSARGASFVCALALAAPDGQYVTSEARVPGVLVWPPRGDLGAGFEPMFVAQGQRLTYGEMQPEARHAINHRAAAFRMLVARLPDALEAPPSAP